MTAITANEVGLGSREFLIACRTSSGRSRLVVYWSNLAYLGRHPEAPLVLAAYQIDEEALSAAENGNLDVAHRAEPVPTPTSQEAANAVFSMPLASDL
jgi:hypothetical protein